MMQTADPHSITAAAAAEGKSAMNVTAQTTGTQDQPDPADRSLSENLVCARNGDPCYQAEARVLVRRRLYNGRKDGSVWSATWQESLESMERYLVTLRETGASEERIERQLKCIARHIETRP